MLKKIQEIEERIKDLEPYEKQDLEKIKDSYIRFKVAFNVQTLQTNRSLLVALNLFEERSFKRR